jgi:hypothetical protein
MGLVPFALCFGGGGGGRGSVRDGELSRILMGGEPMV